MKLSQLKLAPIAAAMVMLAAAGTANAGAYALSSDNVQGFSITAIAPTGIVASNAVDTSSTQAFLNGVPVSGIPGGAGVSDAGIAIAPGSVLPAGHTANNSEFTNGPVGHAAGTQNYSYADALITHTGTFVFNAQNVAEAHLFTAGTGSGTATNSSATGFTSTLTLTNSTAIQFDFTADPLIQVFLQTANSFAQGVVSATLTITCQQIGGCGAVPNGGVAFSYVPNGTGVGGTGVTGIIGGTDNLDPENLNITVTQTVIGSQDYSLGLGLQAYRATTNNLPTGTYSLSLAMAETDAVIKVIPEPGTIALLGLGLAGLGFASRRKPV